MQLLWKRLSGLQWEYRNLLCGHFHREESCVLQMKDMNLYIKHTFIVLYQSLSLAYSNEFSGHSSSKQNIWLPFHQKVVGHRLKPGCWAFGMEFALSFVHCSSCLSQSMWDCSNWNFCTVCEIVRFYVRLWPAHKHREQCEPPKNIYI